MQGSGATRPFTSFKEAFEAAFPFYLAIGMSADEFWRGDPRLVEFYRAANEQRMRQRDFQAWLQGRYVYEAVADVAPILNPLSKRSRARKYAERPYMQAADERDRERTLAAQRANGAIAAEDISRRIGRILEAQREQDAAPVIE